ncbi:MAG: glycerophosphodiester phosphodiesterase family protein [Gammaproteobacteria bacterium]
MTPVLVAHRGYSAQAPENTLASVHAALDAGACCIEFDVQMCADGRFAVIHDVTLKRTAAIDGSVFEATVAELQAVSVHEALRFGDKFFPAPVPALQQLLDVIAAHPALTAFVEIKEESLAHWGVEKVMQLLIAELEKYHSQCVVISFSESAVDYVQKHSELRTGWVLTKYDAVHQASAEQLQPDFLICNQRKINTSEPWSGRWQWMLYGVETAQLALDWGRRGVAFVETDHIVELLQDLVLQQGACQHE